MLILIMEAKLLYNAIEENKLTPIAVWSKLTYAAKMLYCEREIELGHTLPYIRCVDGVARIEMGDCTGEKPELETEVTMQEI